MTASWLRTHPALDRPGWVHGWTTAAGPDFGSDPATEDHATAAEQLTGELSLPAAAWVKQVHGGTVLEATGPGCAGEADALWTDRPGLGVVGRSADCPLVLLAMDGPPPRWGFAHASWRSTVAGISGRLLAAMTRTPADPASARAVICPSAGPCCYEVGSEVRDAALDRLGPGAGAFFVACGERWIMDLWAANRAQLVALGVPDHAIHTVGICTICGTDYPSHRRDGAAATRFAAAVGHTAQR